MGSGFQRRVVALVGALLFGMAWPTVVLGATPAPSEPCVAGTVWEDPTSGVKYLCVYDELFGGTRWELISSGQTGARAWAYRSSTNGCLSLTVAIGANGGQQGGDVFARTYRWPCSTVADRSFQPSGEIRVRTVLQRMALGWTTCRDTGYGANGNSAWTLVAGARMGRSADCGPGLYRTLGYGQFYQAGAWRGSTLASPSMWLP